jgi:hypothetical protein
LAIDDCRFGLTIADWGFHRQLRIGDSIDDCGLQIAIDDWEWEWRLAIRTPIDGHQSASVPISQSAITRHSSIGNRISNRQSTMAIGNLQSAI